jgi:hypothetical protein
MNKLIELISILAVSVAIIIITAVAFGFPISWLWNIFCPKVFGLPTIDWVDGAVVYILSRVLFATNYSSN